MAPTSGLATATVLDVLQSGHGSTRGFQTSFVKCPADARPKFVKVPAPPCIDGGLDCSGKEDFTQLRDFAKSVDESMKDQLDEAKQMRLKFERKVCDFRYTEFENKGELLNNTYGPKGPLMPGGSYIYDMRRWADSILMLYRGCNRGYGGCSSLINYLRDHPEDDVGAGGQHGKAGSKVFNELRKACEVGKTRAPIPNDSPVWCFESTGLCEQRSCKTWWRKVHDGASEPWVDDRVEYDQLKNACDWIENKEPTNAELDKYQREVKEKALQDKMDFCVPKWIEGYCPHKAHVEKFGECELKDGASCKHGRIFPGTEEDATEDWKEIFPEEEVDVEEKGMPLQLLLLALARPYSAAPRPAPWPPSQSAQPRRHPGPGVRPRSPGVSDFL